MDWDAQKAIWDGIFTTDYLMVSSCIPFCAVLALNATRQLDPTESSLLMTEPYFNLPNLQDVYDQFVFEEYEFQSYYRCTRTVGLLGYDGLVKTRLQRHRSYPMENSTRREDSQTLNVYSLSTPDLASRMSSQSSTVPLSGRL